MIPSFSNPRPSLFASHHTIPYQQTQPHNPTNKQTVRNARKAAQTYYRQYREPKPISQLVKSTASLMQEYTQSGGVRPFGVSLLLAGLDADGTPRLYQVDPSGAYFGWKATAIGRNYTSAKAFLEKRYQEAVALCPPAPHRQPSEETGFFGGGVFGDVRGCWGCCVWRWAGAETW